MTLFSLTSFFLVFTALHQSHGNLYFDRILHAQWEPRGSLACFKTLTVELFQNSKEVIDENCIRNEENEFKSTVDPRSQSFEFIMKRGKYKELFEERIKQAEEIGTKVIKKIDECLQPNCNKDVQERVERFIKNFKKGSTGCGDSKYLSSAIKILEKTCAKENDDSESYFLKFFFPQNEDSHAHDMNNPWIRENRLHIE